MRTSSRVARLAAGGVLVALAGGLGLGVGTWPGAGIGIAPEAALAFDGTSSPTTAALAPGDSVRSAARVPEGGERAKTLTALWGRWGVDKTQFWWLMGFDQFLHQATNIALAAAFFAI